MMGLIPLVTVTLCYFWLAIDLGVAQKNLPMAWTYVFYAAANVTLLWTPYKPHILALMGRIWIATL